VVNLGGRFIDGTLGHGALSLAALFASLICAWLFHISVERPAIELSRLVRPRRTSDAPGAAASAGVVPTLAQRDSLSVPRKR
jgi:peptidoglycan/LPS O-acetylase OafA/YrhL